MDSRVFAILYYIRVPVGIKRTILLYHMFFLLFSVSGFLSKVSKCSTHTGPGLNPAESLEIRATLYGRKGALSKCFSNRAVTRGDKLMNDINAPFRPFLQSTTLKQSLVLCGSDGNWGGGSFTVLLLVV